MKKLLALLALLAAPAEAADFPRDIPLTWTNPTEYTDGSPIQAGELESVYLACFRQNDLATIVAEDLVVINPVVGSTQSYTLVGAAPQPGTYLCFAKANTVDGVASDWSNEKVIKFTGKPLPPVVIN